VEDPDLQFRIDEILDVLMADNVLAWELGSDGNWTRIDLTSSDVNTWDLGDDGSWTKVDQTTQIDTHVALQDLAMTRSRVPGPT
jgi:polyphosphate kinase